jgi:hypothetical protein
MWWLCNLFATTQFAHSQRDLVFMVVLYFLCGVRPPFYSGVWDHTLFPLIEWRLAQRRASTAAATYSSYVHMHVCALVCFALISPLWGDDGSCVLISLIPVMSVSLGSLGYGPFRGQRRPKALLTRRVRRGRWTTAATLLVPYDSQRSRWSMVDLIINSWEVEINRNNLEFVHIWTALTLFPPALTLGDTTNSCVRAGPNFWIRLKG